MATRLRTARRRPNMRKAVFLFPSGLTLLNLFFGIFAIISASRLEFTTAGVYVVIGGICDALDGRVARATNAGTQFGEELDSLVDAITFGLAPGMIMYYAVLNRGGWDWLVVFLFSAAAVLRLARFNIEQAGTAKTYFQGLPSPAAGITLASYYWFSESWLYSYGRIANLNWHFTLRVLMAVLAGLMISNVPYPTFPRTGFRSLRALGASIIVFGAFALLLTGRLEYFFPLAILYVAFGLVRWLLSGLFERRQPTLPYDLSEGEDDEDEEEFEDLDTLPIARAGHHDEAAARQERLRGRAARPERPEVAEPSPRPERPDRPPRKPDRPERAAVAERPADSDRAARRDKKKDRPKRPDRPERVPRPPRPDGALTAAAAPAASPAPPSAGVDAITVGAPDVESLADHGDLTATGDEGDEETAIEGGAPVVEGAPPRKRKRRRRRGERKERGPVAPAEGAGGEWTAGTPAGGAPAAPRSESDVQTPPGDHDQSPYAASPAPLASAPAASSPASTPASPPPLPSPPATSSEFPE